MLSVLVPDELQLGYSEPQADLSQVAFYVPEYMGPRSSLELIEQMPNLEVVQLLTVGFDAALKYVPDHVSLCNAVGVHDASTAELIQQVGQPAAGCENLSLPSLDWAGVSSSGWAPSWAEWVNGGRGGPVCTRTLAYSTNTNAWFVRP